MAGQEGWYPCYVCLMKQRGRLTRVGVKGKVLLLFMLNHGMLRYNLYLNWGKTMGKKKKEPGTCFKHCGFLIYLWRGLGMIKIGLCSVLMRLRGWLMFKGMNLTLCSWNKSKRGRAEWPSRQRVCGYKSLKAKLKQALLKCCTRIVRIKSQIRTIWVLLKVVICALRLYNNRVKMK